MSDLATPPSGEESVGVTVEEALAQELVERARSEGVELVGPGGLLTGLTKTVLETALEAELDEHLGYPKHAVEGNNTGNSRNGVRAKTVITDIGRPTSRCRVIARGRSIRRSLGSGSAGWSASTRW